MTTLNANEYNATTGDRWYVTRADGAWCVVAETPESMDVEDVLERLEEATWHAPAGTYSLHRAAIDDEGLQTDCEPVAVCQTLREALHRADDVSLHGPEGIAVRRPDGRVIYTADEYQEAAEEAEASA